ncbi:hypothetical protein BH18ACT12_BH18ACT12_12510 [soil metagenome]
MRTGGHRREAGQVRSFRGAEEGVAVELTGAQILALAADKHVTAITSDARVRLSAAPTSNEKWPHVTGVTKYWATGVNPGSPAATIAIVDSGIEASRPEFGGRVVAVVNLTTLSGNSGATAVVTECSWRGSQPVTSLAGVAPRRTRSSSHWT